MSVSIAKLSQTQQDFVQSLATLAYGHGVGQGAKGGVGNMGLAMIGGEMRVFKCNTHRSQVKTASTGAGDQALTESSDRLREALVTIGKEAGLKLGRINQLLGIPGGDQGQPSLLTRKVVAKFVSEVTGERSGGKGNVWVEARNRSRGMVSVADMKFATMVRNSNRYKHFTLDVERGSLEKVVDESLDTKEMNIQNGVVDYDNKPDAVKIRERLDEFARKLSGNIFRSPLTDGDLKAICGYARKNPWFVMLRDLLQPLGKAAEADRRFWCKTLTSGEMEYGKTDGKSDRPKQKKDLIFDALATMVAKWADPSYQPGRDSVDMMRG